ncbi:uncharacterized protein BT62DRAFT_773219 [Guyanagaster necrorhizus]|uniref:RNA polymerase II-associated protein 3 n=1 Tax=Guyanagaster necrorhizus TaxID=856835 RepID=A0A9P8AKZ9_9AGAR|nr:uncharacterized protein BT62DRAFT_773219 [Guyanagaster necrorhizus MCA 3950]KAG7439204.1 hypothetical protein BT62DRAFT_773219 [Guyanagaster necrorhizus MCA 3950]
MSSKQGQLDKEKGNTSFKAGDYAMAVGHYSSAIVNDRKDYTLPLNRAAAYLKLGKYDDAERDCTTVLSLNISNAKALFRRSQARVGMGKLKEAEGDLRAAAKLEPSNVSITQEITKVTDAIKRSITISKTKPIDVTLNSKPTRRRIPITIVEDTVEKPSASGISSMSEKIEPFTQPVATKQTEIQPIQASKEERTSSTPQVTYTEAKRSRDDVKTSRVGGGIFRSDGPNTIFPTREVTVPKSNDAKAATYPITQNFPASTAPKSPSVPVPKTLYDLTKAWDMHPSTEERFRIITSVPPAQLPVLFQASLEPSFLASIVEIFRSASDEEKNASIVVEYLDALSKVPRIGTITLFLSEGERTVLRRLVEKVGVDKVNAVWRKV